MAQIFVSYAEEDAETAASLAGELEAAGYSVWYYKRHMLPGRSYLLQTREAIEAAEAFLLLVTPQSIDSGQVTLEITRYMELGKKAWIPVLVGLDHEALRERNPEWHQMLGAAVAVNADAGRPEAVTPKIVAGLEGMGLYPAADAGERTTAAGRETASGLAAYRENLIAEINNSLVPELYERPHYEDIIITTLVRALGRRPERSDVHELATLANLTAVTVIGEPGSGKTTALRKLALDLLRAEPMRRIPVYVSLAGFSRARQQNASLSFAEHVDDELDILAAPGLGALARAPATRLLLLLDGWDEIPSDDVRRDVRRYLVHCAHAWIITSRPEAVRTLPACDHYEMLALSERRMAEFIRLRVKDPRKADQLQQWVVRTPSIRKLARNALNLSVMTIVFSEEVDIENLTKTKLYQRAFEMIIRQHHKAQSYEGVLPEDGSTGRAITVLQVESILERLAYETVKGAQGRFFSVRQLLQVAEEVLGFSAPRLPQLLSGRLGVIRDRRAGRFEFFHIWYQEFLAARRIVQCGADVAAELGHELFAGALAYVVGLLQEGRDAAELMEAVPIHDPFSYCRAISEGQFSDQDVRRFVLRALRFGEGPPRIPVRIEMCKALTEIGPQAMPALFSICRDPARSDYVRRSALEAIMLIDPHGAEPRGLLVELLESLAGSCTGLLWHVLEHVGNLAVPEAEPLLPRRARSDNPITAGDSIWALQQITGREPSALPDQLVQGLLAKLSDKEAHTQGHAVRTIGRLGIRQAVPELEQLLLNQDADFRWAVPEALGAIATPEALELLAVALDDRDRRVTAYALKGIADCPEPCPDALIERVRRLTLDTTFVEYPDVTVSGLAKRALQRIERRKEAGSPATILIARHAKTQWNLDGKVQGKSDQPLCRQGEREAHEAAEALSGLGINRIVSSTARRAEQTARIYARHLDVPLSTTPGLRELDHGDWETAVAAELKASPRTGYARWLADPASTPIPGSKESVSSAQQRVKEALRNVAQSYRDQTVLVISHKHITALLMCALLKRPLSAFSSVIEESLLPRRLPLNAVLDLCSETDPALPEGP